MYMNHKTQKVHGRLLERRPGSTPEISSVLFTQFGERRWSCTGSHQFVFLGGGEKKERKSLNGVGTENMPLFGVKLLKVSNCTCLQE